MLEEVVAEIKATLPKNSKVVVGVSGGADSMTLLHLMHRSGYPLIVVHINFHLRGEESDRDETFVCQVMEKLYPMHMLVVQEFDTERYAQANGVSIEMAARELRYELYTQVATQYQANAIALGHNAGDQVETLLLNLARGTGGKGLVGMKYWDRNILRPLLYTTRNEIIRYLEEYQLPHVEDSTNSETIFKRNLIRHKIMPLMEELNPSFIPSTLQSMAVFAQEQELIDNEVERFKMKRWEKDLARFSLSNLEEEKHAELLFYRFLQPLGFSAQQVSDILQSANSSGKLFYTEESDRQRVYELFRGYLYQCEEPSGFPPQSVSDIGTYQLGTLGTLRIDDERGDLRVNKQLLQNGDMVLRMGTSRDRFRPFGMKKGNKALFEYLKEQGVPSFYRTYCPVLAQGDQVIAVPPLQIADEVKVLDSEPLFISFLPTRHPLSQLLYLDSARQQKRRMPHSSQVE